MNTQEQMIALALEASSEMLTVMEFISATNFNIDAFMVDQFFHALENDMLVYIDDKLITWIGYDSVKLENRKDSFMRALRKLAKPEDIVTKTNDQYEQFINDSVPLIRGTEIYPPVNRSNGKNNTIHVLITGRALKKVMMRCNTKKSDIIQDYYTDMEALFKLYVRYQTEFQMRKTAIANAITSAETQQLKEALEKSQAELAQTRALTTMYGNNMRFMVNKIVNEQEDYIYIGSTQEQARQSYFKIGQSIMPSRREKQLNTAHPERDFRMLEEFCVPRARDLEKRIHAVLGPLRKSPSSEYFYCPFSLIVSLIKIMVDHFNDEISAVRDIINTVFNICENGPINSIEAMKGINPERWTTAPLKRRTNSALAPATDDRTRQIIADHKHLIEGPTVMEMEQEEEDDGGLVSVGQTTAMATPPATPQPEPIAIIQRSETTVVDSESATNSSVIKVVSPPSIVVAATKKIDYDKMPEEEFKRLPKESFAQWAASLAVDDLSKGPVVHQRVAAAKRTLGLQRGAVISVTAIHNVIRKSYTPQRAYRNGAWAPIIHRILCWHGIKVTGVK